MEIRLHGTREDIAAAVARLRESFAVVHVGRLHKNRTGARYRLYVHVRI